MVLSVKYLNNGQDGAIVTVEHKQDVVCILSDGAAPVTSSVICR